MEHPDMNYGGELQLDHNYVTEVLDNLEAQKSFIQKHKSSINDLIMKRVQDVMQGNYVEKKAVFEMEIVETKELVDSDKKITKEEFANDFALRCVMNAYEDDYTEHLFDGIYNMFLDNWNVVSYLEHERICEKICNLLLERSLNKETFMDIVSFYKIAFIDKMI